MGQNTAITRKEFREIVNMHKKWLRGDGGRRANFFGDRFEQGVSMNNIDLTLSDFRNSLLPGMDLSWACLNRADLTNADLTGANLTCADLNYTRFSGASLTNANLGSSNMVHSNLVLANLNGANLKCANLSRSTMHGANLRGADLNHACLSYADLTSADLTGADLSHADLTGADLSHAYLTGAYLSHADLTGAKLNGAGMTCANIYGCKFDETENARLGTILESPITGYKKSKEGRIVTLEIPKGAIVFSINNGKCRTNMAKVIDTEGEAELTSSYDPKFKYRAGEEIMAKDFCMAYNIECGHGIHFFKTRDEAVRYKIL